MADEKKAAVLEIVDLEAQTQFKEDLPFPVTTPATSPISVATSTKPPPHPMLSIFGLWTLIRPSYEVAHTSLDSVAILLFWHDLGPLIIYIWNIWSYILSEDFELVQLYIKPSEDPVSKTKILIGRIAMAFIGLRLGCSLSGACGCTYEARKYGSRWLRTSYLHDAAGGRSSFGAVLNMAARRLLWSLARIHEQAWSVAFTTMCWNFFLLLWNGGDVKDPLFYTWSEAVTRWFQGYLVLIAVVRVRRAVQAIWKKLLFSRE